MTSYVLDRDTTAVTEPAPFEIQQAVLYINTAQEVPGPITHYLELHYVEDKKIPREVEPLGNPVRLKSRQPRIYPPPTNVSTESLRLIISDNSLSWNLRLKTDDDETIFMRMVNREFTHQQPVVLPDDLDLRDDYARYDLADVKQISYVIYTKKSLARRSAENFYILPFTLAADIITFPIQLGVGILVMASL